MVPILGVIYLAITNKTYLGSNVVTQWQRIMEIRFDIFHGIFPQFMTHVGEPLGSAYNIFSSFVTLLPYVLLTLFIKRPIHLMYAIYTLIWITISFSSYFSAETYFRSRRKAILFAVLYTAASPIGNTLLLNNDLNQALNFAFVPLVLFGFLNLLRNKARWAMVYAGISLMAFSDLPMTIVMLLILGAWTLLDLKPILKSGKIILDYAKIGFFTILTTAFAWMPWLYISIHNRYFVPVNKYFLSGLFISHSGPLIRENCGFIDIIGILIGVVTLIYSAIKRHWIIKMHYIDWQVWLTGIFFWLLNARVPLLYHLFSKQPLITLQESFKSALFLHFCFTFIVTQWLVNAYEVKKNKAGFKRIAIALFVFLAVFMQVGNQLNDWMIFKDRPTYTASRNTQFWSRMKQILDEHGHLNGISLDDHSFDHLKNSQAFANYEPLDIFYNPHHYNLFSTVGWRSIALSGSRFKDHKRVRVSAKGIHVNYRSHASNVIVPLMFYNGYRYTVTDYGYRIRWNHLKNINFVELPRLRKGSHQLMIHAYMNTNTKEALGLSALGLVSFAGLKYCGHRLLKRKEAN